MSRFKELRVRTGLTQREFIEDFNRRFGRNYTAAGISQIENGLRMPEIGALTDFADYFGVSLDYLIGHDKNCPEILQLTRQREFLYGFEKLDPENQYICLKYIKFLLEEQKK